MRSTLFLAALFSSGGAQALRSYQLVQNYSGPSFFDDFSFFSAVDPTFGFVKYVDMENANATGLAGFASSDSFQNVVYLSVDSSTISTSPRASTRIQSTDTFNSSTLWIADIRHHPGTSCGVWSAFWMVGPNWPQGGEIDLFENINLATTNKYALHTGSNLEVRNFSNPTVANSTGMNVLGKFSNLNCSAAAEGNVGCVVEGLNNTFGAGWNNQNGGVIAMEYLPEAISVWQFFRSEIPADITAGTPAPSTWRTPDAHFMSNDGQMLDDSFTSLQMVFNIDICGSWIDKVWSTSECASLAPSCAAYAAQNPTAFSESYWLIDGVQVYQPSTDMTNGTAPLAMPAPNMTVMNMPPSNMTATSEYRHRARRTSVPLW